MEEVKKVTRYILSRLDNTTSWIGLIGLILHIGGFHLALTLLFVALFVLPEGNFSSIFKSWTSGLRKIEQDIENK